jgi:hypothetical protein
MPRSITRGASQIAVSSVILGNETATTTAARQPHRHAADDRDTSAHRDAHRGILVSCNARGPCGILNEPRGPGRRTRPDRLAWISEYLD